MDNEMSCIYCPYETSILVLKFRMYVYKYFVTANSRECLVECTSFKKICIFLQFKY